MLTAFPHLSESEFRDACRALLEAFERHGRTQTEWAAVETVCQNETTYLRISKTLPLGLGADAGSETEVDVVDNEMDQIDLDLNDSSATSEPSISEDDNEVAQPEPIKLPKLPNDNNAAHPSQPKPSHPTIHYDILLSPTYRVPVLYLTLSTASRPHVAPTSALYARIVPRALRAQVASGGVLGGVSVTVS